MLIITLRLFLAFSLFLVTFSAPSPRPTSFANQCPKIEEYLSTHNDVRQQHGAKPLEWRDDLEQLAQEWADNCHFAHSSGKLLHEPYGENIVAGTGNFPISAAVGTFTQDAGKCRTSGCCNQSSKF
jgi:uncharacterized protein YkwD